MADDKIKKGGAFLIEETDLKEIFTPDDLTEEHRMIQATAQKFIEGEVLPEREKVENLEYEVTRGLLRKAGELGLLGIDIGEDYGGVGLDKISSMVVADEIGKSGSFSVIMGAHTGIGALPIVYYGNEDQKKKYLPKLATGEQVIAFALTEPECGSDAFSTKTTAKLSEDKKHYVLNGTKQFITNGGFADLFIVFAKLDGEKHTAFIVERGFEGFSSGEEEKKMGIKGSSTTPLKLENVKVPAENLLGEPGIGVKIALNILNTGRFKLGVGCIGSCKDVLAKTIEYTGQREQFGKPVNQFGLIMEKLANMGIRIFTAESAAYRAIGHIQKLIDGIDKASDTASKEILKSIEEYSIECAVMKVLGSEVLDYVVDEGMQSYGGYGYIQEYPIERAYRDSRINRLFEGTNEINRMVITGMLMRKAQKGELDLMTSIKAIQQEITELPQLAEESGELLAAERKALVNAKKAALLVAGAATQKFDKKVQEEEEILVNVANCIIDVYTLESALLRILKMAEAKGSDKVDLYADMLKVYCFEAMQRMDMELKSAAAATYEGDEFRVLQSALKRFMKYTPINVKECRRRIARFLIEQGRYAF